MKIGAITSAMLAFDAEDGLALLREHGVEAVEIACAGYHTDRRHGDPSRLVRDDGERRRWLDTIASYGLTISAFAVHGPALSPDRAAAAAYEDELRIVMELAEACGVTRLTLFAGLPEGAPGDTMPCWVVTPWPPENAAALDYQWNERLLPYWQKQAGIAASHGCELCFELHPTDLIHNADAFGRFHAEIGEVVACNLDPSHLFWQGIDPVATIDALGDRIRHVHAKDTWVNPAVVATKGVLDTHSFRDPRRRSWTFRTLGYGHDEVFWRGFVSALRRVGYDDVLSIEHEDPYVDFAEGLAKGAELLRRVMFVHPPRHPGLAPPG